MQINITAKNFQITPALKTHTQEKISGIGKRFSDITQVHVVLHIEHIDHIAEATAHFLGNEVHAKASAKDMYAAIDGLVDKLTGQMHKLKEKTIDSHR